jgi:hypothetical protein
VIAGRGCAVFVAAVLLGAGCGNDDGRTDVATSDPLRSSTTVEAGPASASAWHVSVGGADLGPLEVTTGDLVDAPGLAGHPELRPWKQHVVTVTNRGTEPVTVETMEMVFHDDRTLLVGFSRQCGPVHLPDGLAGACRLLDVAFTLAPGASHGLEVTVWRDLMGMTPTTSPIIAVDAPVEFGPPHPSGPYDPPGRGLLVLTYEER